MKKGSLIVISFLFLASAHYANAASLSFSPSNRNMSVGEKITVSVLVDSAGVAINNAEGTVSFPTNQFDVVSVNKDASIFTLWITNPSYEGDGSVSFNGGLQSPGYQGSNGTLFTITLRAKAAGQATLSLANAAVRANDGLGTNVLTGTNTAQISIAGNTPVAPVPVESAPVVLAANGVGVTSPTNPSQDAWYSQKNALLQFALPAGATAVETILAKHADTLPSVIYKPAIAEKTVTNIDDGIWYFNIRARVGSTWGDVTSYRLQIDTASPIAEATFLFNARKQALYMEATSSDALSGVASYVVLVDGATTTTLAPQHLVGSATIPLHVAAGEHQVTLRVFDAAGNSIDIPGTIVVPSAAHPFAAIMHWLSSGIGTQVMIVCILLLCLLLVLMNIVLWLKLTAHKRPGGKDIVKIKKVTKKKLLNLKKDLVAEDKKLEKVHAHKKLTTAEADSLKKTRTTISETTKYLDEKAKEIK